MKKYRHNWCDNWRMIRCLTRLTRHDLNIISNACLLEGRSPIKTPLKKHVNFTSVLLLQAILCMQIFRYKLRSKNRTKPQSVVWAWDFSTYLVLVRQEASYQLGELTEKFYWREGIIRKINGHAINQKNTLYMESNAITK